MNSPSSRWFLKNGKNTRLEVRVPRNGTDVVDNVGCGGGGFHWVRDPSEANVNPNTKDSILVVIVKHDTSRR